MKYKKTQVSSARVHHPDEKWAVGVEDGIAALRRWMEREDQERAMQEQAGGGVLSHEEARERHPTCIAIDELGEDGMAHEVAALAVLGFGVLTMLNNLVPEIARHLGRDIAKALVELAAETMAESNHNLPAPEEEEAEDLPPGNVVQELGGVH